MDVLQGWDCLGATPNCKVQLTTGNSTFACVRIVQRRVGKLWRARARRFIFSVWRFKIAFGADFSAIAPD